MRAGRLVGIVVLAGAAAALWAVGPPPASGQVSIPSSSTTSAPTTSTTKPPTTTTSAPPSTTTTAPRRTTTTAPTTTVPQRTTTTIATPAPGPTTTLPPEPTAKHDGRFSPVLVWLSLLGLLSFFGLLGLQWALTRPGREGWTL